jgi:hypothetical protein
MLETMKGEFPELQIILGGQAFRHVSNDALQGLGNIVILSDLYLLEKYIDTMNSKL